MTAILTPGMWSWVMRLLSVGHGSESSLTITMGCRHEVIFSIWCSTSGGTGFGAGVVWPMSSDAVRKTRAVSAPIFLMANISAFLRGWYGEHEQPSTANSLQECLHQIRIC